MSLKKTTIKNWLLNADRNKYSHMIVAVDTFDYDHYPVFVEIGKEAREAVADVESEQMQKVCEVYNLQMPIQAQLDESRSYNF